VGVEEAFVLVLEDGL